jgi:microcystin-dependent protein
MASTPILGSIFLFAGNFAPRGYALCQGQLIAISSNAALFSILGTTYGGNGTTTFALPDLRGRAPIGVGQGAGLQPIVLGQSQGVETVTLSANNMPKHNHTIGCDSNANDTTALSPANAFISAQASVGQGGSGVTNFSPGPANATLAATAVSQAGASLPFSVQNPCLGITYIIATQGVFPSRN